MRGPRSSAGALRIGGGPSGRAPSGLGSLIAYAPQPIFGWEAAAAGVADLSILADSYGGSLTLTQGTAGKRATNSATLINGRVPLAFVNANATEYGRTTGGITGNADHAMIALWKSANNSVSYSAITSFGPSGGNTSAAGKNGNGWWLGGSGDVNPTTNLADDLGWHLVTKRHAGGKDYWQIDGAPVLSPSVALVPNPYTQTYNITSAAFGLGTSWGSGAKCPSGDLAAAIWYASITAANVQIVERYIALRFAVTKNPQIVCKGDSLTLGSTSDASHLVASPYPSQLAALLGITVDVTNLGVFGQTAATMVTNESTEVLPLWSSIRGVASPTASPRNTLVFWAGTNDANGGDDAATIYARISSYCTAARAAGFRVIVVTPIRRTTGSTLNSTLSALRDLILAGWSGFADGVVDLWSKPEFSDTTNATYYAADGVHLVQAGYNAVAGYVAAVAKSIA